MLKSRTKRKRNGSGRQIRKTDSAVRRILGTSFALTSTRTGGTFQPTTPVSTRTGGTFQPTPPISSPTGEPIQRRPPRSVHMVVQSARYNNHHRHLHQSTQPPSALPRSPQPLQRRTLMGQHLAAPAAFWIPQPAPGIHSALPPADRRQKKETRRFTLQPEP